MSTNYMVFDVESLGLFGPAIAVGYVIVNKKGEELDSGGLRIDPEEMMERENSYQRYRAVSPTDEKWVEAHVFPAIEHLPQVSERYMYRRFNNVFQQTKAILVADCLFPVETNFLWRCSEYCGWTMDTSPYPVHEVATALLLAGKDPLGSYGRLESELPEHCPVADARQSARVWLECLKGRKSGS